MSAVGHHSHGGNSNGPAPGPATPADRLARLLARHALPEQHIAHQLGWPLEQLQAYIAPENRHDQAAQRGGIASQELENAVEKLLMRYEIAQASGTVKRAAKTPLVPSGLAMRRAHAIPQLARYMTDRRSVFQFASPPVSSAEEAAASQSINHRKRKRRAVVKALSEFPTPSRIRPSTDVLCPIRIDVDADGARYQDTLLINSALPQSSPEDLATRIALDEQLPDTTKDAIAESIKRQLMAFASFVGDSSESLHPITLDIVINGLALRDQFEWDVYCDLNNAETFAATLRADLNLPEAFEPAIAFSIREQVYAYRRVLYSKRWIGNDPVVQKAAAAAAASAGHPAQPRPLGINSLEPVDGTVIREPSEVVLWQPVLSQLGTDELQYLSTKTATQRRPLSVKPPPVHHHERPPKKTTPKFKKETKFPRPINPFIMYCQVQKDSVIMSKTRRSASESRKIMGDMWRKMTEEEKEYYAQLTEVENEKRRREYVFELRDRAISEWEDEEARRVGLLGSGVIDASTEHVRGLFLENYINERHEVDSNRPVEPGDAEEDVDGDNDYE